MTAGLAAFLAGVLFAIGLGIAGMTQPAKVLAFLDVGGAWDPSLALVMLGAIAVHAPFVRLILRRRAPVAAPAFSLPASRAVDGALLLGATVFGIGWGLAGLCPGPAVTLLASGRYPVLLFVAAMIAGMGIVTLLERGMTSRAKRRADGGIVVLASRRGAVSIVRRAYGRRPRSRPSPARAPSPD